MERDSRLNESKQVDEIRLTKMEDIHPQLVDASCRILASGLRITMWLIGRDHI